MISSIKLVKSTCGGNNSKGRPHHGNFVYDAWYIDGSHYDDGVPRISTISYDGIIRLFNFKSGELEHKTKRIRDLFGSLLLHNGNIITEDENRRSKASITFWDHVTLERLRTITSKKLRFINSNYLQLDEVNLLILNYYRYVMLVCFEYDRVFTARTPRMFGICRLKTDKTRFFTCGFAASFWKWDKRKTKIYKEEVLNIGGKNLTKRLECCETYVLSKTGEEFVCVGGCEKKIYILDVEKRSVVTEVDFKFEEIYSFLNYSNQEMIVGGKVGLYSFNLISHKYKVLIDRVIRNENSDAGGLRSHRTRWVGNGGKIFYYVSAADRDVKFISVEKKNMEDDDMMERKLFLFEKGSSFSDVFDIRIATFNTLEIPKTFLHI